MNNISKNVSYLLVSSLVGVVTQITQFVLMGRLLSSEEVGVASTVLVVVVFAQMFTDFGLSGYYVHRQNATRDEKSTLYWLNILLGTCIAIFIVLASPLISSFFGKTELKSLFMLCAISFPIIAAGSQFQAELLKCFKYKQIAIIEIFARLVGVLSFVFAINLEFGPSSVVIAHVINSTVKTIALFLYFSSDYYPRFSFKYEYAVGGIKYGGYLILGQAFNQVGQNLDKILIGKLLGMSSLGIYTLAKDLSMRAMQIVNPVVNKLCLPRYAKRQNNTESLVIEVENTLLVIGFFSSLLFFSLSLCSSIVVDVLYGENKKDVIPILSIIPFYVLFRSFGNISGTLLGALGKTKLDFKWNVIAVFISGPIVYFLSNTTTIYLAVGMVCLQFILTILSYFILIKPILPLRFKSYLVRMMIFPTLAAVYYIIAIKFVNLSDTYSLIAIYITWIFMYLMSSYIYYQRVIKK